MMRWHAKLTELASRLKPLNHQLTRTFPWSLGFALGMILYFAPHPEWHGDLAVFREAAETLRHPYWARWLFTLLARPPEIVAFILLSLFSTALLYFAIIVFQGRHWMVFTSFAFAWTLFYGQIDGLVVGGLAVAWWAMTQNRPYLVGLGIILASIKPQLSLPLILAIWWWSPSRLKSLAFPAVVVGLSFVQWGWWVPEWLQNLRFTQDLVGLSRNISLWPIIGAWVLLAWPVILWLPLERSRKLVAVAAGTALTVPYFPLPSSVLLLCMPVPWWTYVTAQLPILSGTLGEWLYYPVKFLPLALLVWLAWPLIKHKWHGKKLTRISRKDE